MKRDSDNGNDTPRPSDDEAIEATAAAWLAQCDDGLSRDEELEFARWRTADSRHEAAVARLEGAWAALHQLRDFRPEAARHPDRDLLRMPAPRRARIRSFPTLVTMAIAASLALAAIWWGAANRRAGERAPLRYATTVDGYERLTLEDGSQLELNAASEVAVQFTPAERRVRLVRGEAHFTVAKNKARPFSVEAGTIAVRAIGTAFNVRLGTSDVEVLVTEGKVELNQTGGPALAAAPFRFERDNRDGLPASGSPTFLTANERTTISTVSAAVLAPIVEKVAPEVVREALAWQGPRLVFVDTPLADAIAKFNRRNPVQIVLADADLGTLPIGGSFRAEHVDAFVRLLTAEGDIVVGRRDATRIELRKAK